MAGHGTIQRPSTMSPPTSPADPEDSTGKNRDDFERPEFRLVCPFSIPTSPEAASLRIIRNLGHFALCVPYISFQNHDTCAKDRNTQKDRKLESSSNFSINLKEKGEPTFVGALVDVLVVEKLYLKKNIGYSHVGLSYENAVEGHHWRIITSAFSHISVIHLVFNMSALWSLGVVEQLGHIGLGMAYYLHYTLVLVVLSGALVLGMYHILIQRFKLEYFRRVTAVGYSCVVFGWMTILSVKQPSSKLDLFGFLSLPISFAPFESLIFTSIIVPQASFLGHLSGIVVGYAIAWGLIHGMNNFWAISMLGWIVLFSVVSLKRSGAYDFDFIEIESVMDPSLPSVRFPGTGRTLQMSALPVEGVEIV
ncbi:hypothetical protein POTOM_053330 [Populus tomentosa]|uniref:Peptidase S54 rhomboid domain-containing protein n=1 Tax=Populus tomentosa TaxID=118781 RepID=A0A8X8C4G9_POPTO|nr:hypothetical protein POTOM_053330 [Populus tomentosa]